PGVRVELAVAVELEDVSAEDVGPRLDDVADDPPGHVADVGRVVVGLDAYLGQRVRARLVTDAVVHRVVDLDPVDHEVVRLLPVAVDVGTGAGAPVGGIGLGARVGRDRAGQQEGELARVAAVERQRLDGLAGEDLAHGRRLRLQDRGLGGDL